METHTKATDTEPRAW